MNDGPSTRSPGYSGPRAVAPPARVACPRMSRSRSGTRVARAFACLSGWTGRRRRRGCWPFCIGVGRLRCVGGGGFGGCDGDSVRESASGCGCEGESGVGGYGGDDGGDGAGESVSIPRLGWRLARRPRRRRGLVMAEPDASSMRLIGGLGAYVDVDGYGHGRRLRRRMVPDCLLRSWTRLRHGRLGGGGLV